VKYVDVSAALRVLFREPGPSFAPADGDAVVSSQLLEVEAFRAVDRERLRGHLDELARGLNVRGIDAANPE
jgi:hypothetical protein